MTATTLSQPIILAPAGDKDSFLAAVAAGADAVYCGLKIFSARMEAANFSVEELSRLTRLAHDKGIEVCLAFNSVIKEFETDKAVRILNKLARYTDTDALIVQDPAMVALARKAGFQGELHLSTLGNCTHPLGLASAQKAGFSKVVLPREFNIDEIKAMALAAPDNMDLEVFVHGALCYSVSGRCYWSSWFGGKSALRGRCVQPCRRMYRQKDPKRHFSCMDFSADVLAKVLKGIPKVSTWKIEGRKKSPHYVYYTVKAYRLLRDDPGRKKEALAYLDYAMGRTFTHYNLLSHRTMNPLDHQSETASGLFLGRVKNPAEPYLISREELFAGDLLRIGYEEDNFHQIQKVTRAVPKKGKYFLSKQSRHRITKGTPVFIIDRRGRELYSKIQDLDAELKSIAPVTVRPAKAVPNSTRPARVFGIGKKKGQSTYEMDVFRGRPLPGEGHRDKGMWISTGGYGIRPAGRTWLWLDPLLFPEEETLCRRYVATAVKKGARNFVLNAPWQIDFFRRPDSLNLWAGPFCNITNTRTVSFLKSAGFSGAIVSPELDRESFLSLPKAAALPLGVILKGNWPLAISRIVSPELKLGQVFFSPKGEGAWTAKLAGSYYTFPTWPLDLSDKRPELQRAGYTLFVNLHERIPKGVKIKQRPGLWNWNNKLL